MRVSLYCINLFGKCLQSFRFLRDDEQLLHCVFLGLRMPIAEVRCETGRKVQAPPSLSWTLFVCNPPHLNVYCLLGEWQWFMLRYSKNWRIFFFRACKVSLHCTESLHGPLVLSALAFKTSEKERSWLLNLQCNIYRKLREAFACSCLQMNNV